MIDITRDIQPLTYFRRKSAEAVIHAHESAAAARKKRKPSTSFTSVMPPDVQLWMSEIRSQFFQNFSHWRHATYVLTISSSDQPGVIVKSDRGLRPPRRPNGFLAGQHALHYGGSELLVGPLRPVWRFPYVEEASRETLGLVPSHPVVCG